METSFAGAHRRIAEYRICLQRGVRIGIIPAAAQVDIDACFVAMAGLLDEARVEMEAAGPPLSSDTVFVQSFVAGCSVVASSMFRAMCTEPRSIALRTTAAVLRRQAPILRAQLWARLARAA